MSRIKIPVEDDEQLRQLGETLNKMGFKWKADGPVHHPDGVMVWYEVPLDLYFLGATAVADAHGIFKSPLTR